jgi:hypothetical protein
MAAAAFQLNSLGGGEVPQLDVAVIASRGQQLAVGAEHHWKKGDTLGFQPISPLPAVKT